MISTLKQSFSSVKSTAKWSDPIKLGDLQLKNRIVMSAMTRMRCNPKDGIPTDLLAKYYSQRSGAGLILTECVTWTPRGDAYPGAANLFNKQQKDGWKKVTQAVHTNGGLIFAQIYHGGRACTKKMLGGLDPWAPSPLKIRDLNFKDQSQFDVPHEMTLEDIEQAKKEFKNSAILAKQAGFDGIQFHGANGYLIDTFLKSQTNIRKDQYGGSAENRCRFALQLVDIALEIFKPHQIGIKISPVSRFGDMYDNDPVQTFSTLARLLNQKKIGFIEARESNQPPMSRQPAPKLPMEQVPDVCAMLRPHFDGLLIANEQMNAVIGLQKIRSGNCDLVSFGRPYVSNPDLAERIISELELNTKTDYSALFVGPTGENLGERGYTDYPFYEQWKKQQTQV